jgi:hypothetical protein
MDGEHAGDHLGFGVDVFAEGGVEVEPADDALVLEVELDRQLRPESELEATASCRIRGAVTTRASGVVIARTQGPSISSYCRASRSSTRAPADACVVKCAWLSTVDIPTWLNPGTDRRAVCTMARSVSVKVWGRFMVLAAAVIEAAKERSSCAATAAPAKTDRRELSRFQRGTPRPVERSPFFKAWFRKVHATAGERWSAPAPVAGLAAQVRG